MAGITLTEAESKLTLWLAAEEACAANQSYKIGDRELTRADLEEIGKRVEYWDKKAKELAAASEGRARTRYIVPGEGGGSSRRRGL